jgi:hypothetical protein
MSTPSTPRVRAVLRLRNTKILPLLAAARTLYNGMLAEVARFPAPVPPLGALLAQITALDSAQQVVHSGVHGAATGTRDAARDALWGSILSLKAYVQMVADATGANAVATIKSAGFDVGKPLGARDKPILAPKLTATAGEVKLVANARALTGTTGKRVVYNWHSSVDGGHTWVAAPSTITATTQIGGLPLTTPCSFRVCVTLGGVAQPWSQVVTLLVH